MAPIINKLLSQQKTATNLKIESIAKAVAAKVLGSIVNYRSPNLLGKRCLIICSIGRLALVWINTQNRGNRLTEAPTDSIG